MTTNAENFHAVDSIPEQAYNPNTLNKKEENRKIAFIQAVAAIFKAELKKLIQDAFLREEMFKEWAAKMEDARSQSSKEAWNELFRAILKEIEQKLKQRLNAGQLKVITEKLHNVLQQVQLLSTLKAEFVEEQKVIEELISGIEKRSDDIGIGVSELKSSLAEPTAEPAELEVAAKKVVDLRRAVVSEYSECEDVLKLLNAWVDAFNTASRSTEASIKELTESISGTGLGSSILKEMFGKRNIEDELESISKYKERVFYQKDKLSGYSIEISEAEASIKKSAGEYSPLITSQYAFLNSLNLNSSLRPSPYGRSKEEEKETSAAAVSVFKSLGRYN